MAGNSKKYPNYILFTLSLGISLIIAEISIRAMLGNQLYLPETERSLTYRYDEQLGWFPKEHSTATFDLTTTIDINHNSRGFRDDEHEPDHRSSVVFLGDSFTWGYDVQAEDRFTNVLKDSFPELNLFNMGVSGYGNDQELLLLRDQINFYKPELIILVFCADNDRLDNSMNIRYVNYYKPYFEQHKSTLLLKGQPVPHSAIHWFSENPFASKSYLIRMVVNAWFRNKNPEQILVPDPTHLIIREMFQLASKNDSKLLETATGSRTTSLPSAGRP